MCVLTSRAGGFPFMDVECCDNLLICVVVSRRDNIYICIPETLMTVHNYPEL